MAKLILKAPYYKPGHKTEEGRGRGGMLEYVATREGVELLRGGLVDYIGTRKGSCGLFSDKDVTINLKELSEEINEHRGNVWTLIFSLKREDAERLGYNTAEQWMYLLRSRRNDIAKEMNIDPMNFRWYAAYHNKEKNPHVHMLVWSDRPTEPYLSPTGIHNIKQKIAGDIFRYEMMSVYKKQTEVRDGLKDEFRQRLRELADKLQKDPGEISPELYQNFCLLCQNLSEHKGKKTYAYLDRKTKSLVDDIVKILATDKKIAEMYDLWHELRCETFRTYTDVMPDKIALEDNKEFKSIRNQVITIAANIGTPSDVPFHDVGYDYSELKDRAKDLSYLEMISDMGNHVAMYRVGRYYLEQEYDPDDALYWLKLAADHGNELAMYQVYKGYRDGIFSENSSDKLTYLRMAVDKKFGFAEYEYAITQDKLTPEVKLEYLQRAADHGCGQAEYAIGKIFYERGQVDDALYYFEKAGRRDSMARTHLGLLYCYSLDDWDRGMMLLHSASEQGYEPATEAIRTIERNLDARIVIGVCDLFYYASNLLDERSDDYYSHNHSDGVDIRVKKEDRAKRMGITMSGF